MWPVNRKTNNMEKGLYAHDQAEISSTTELQSGGRNVIPQVHLRIEHVHLSLESSKEQL